MTSTIHKILRHGMKKLKSALLLKGILSQEAAEVRSNFFFENNGNYARIFPRKECNMDILNRLLLIPDPIIIGMRFLLRKMCVTFCKVKFVITL